MLAKKIVFPLLVVLVFLASGACSPEAQQASPQEQAKPTAQADPASLISGAPQDVPIAGMVTMVDIGAHACVPCKMMTPIIEELSHEYDSRAAIVFIDVWEHQDQAAQFGIRTIPTQIFYDADGNESFRHVGFMDKASIVKKLSELGVK